MQAWTDVEKGGGLSSRAAAIKADFQAATAPVDQDLANWIVVSAHGIKLFNDFASGKSTRVTIDHGTNVGEYAFCTLYKDASASVAMAPADTGVRPGSVFCYVGKKALGYTEKATAIAGQYTRSQVSKTILLKAGAGTSFSYEARTLMGSEQYSKDDAGQESDFLMLANPSTIGQVATGNISYVMGANMVSSATIAGNMPARVDFWGTPYTDHESWNINLAVTEEAGDVQKYALSGQISAFKGSDALGAVTLRPGTFVKLSKASGKQLVSEVKLMLTVASPDSSVDGTLSLRNFSTDKTGGRYIPAKVQFIGVFTNPDAEYFNGTFTTEVFDYAKYNSGAALSAANFLAGSASFTGTLKLSKRPTLTLSLSVRETGFKKTEFNGSYTDGSNVISIDGNNARRATVNIHSSAGISLRLVDGLGTANVMRNSSKVAVLNMLSGMIDYVDGSFESVK